MQGTVHMQVLFGVVLAVRVESLAHFSSKFGHMEHSVYSDLVKSRLTWCFEEGGQVSIKGPVFSWLLVLPCESAPQAVRRGIVVNSGLVLFDLNDS